MADTLNISPDEKIAGVPLARLLRNLDETNYNEGALDLACRLSDCKAVIEALLSDRAATKAAAPADAPSEPIMANGLPVERAQMDWVCRFLSENSVFDGSDILQAWNALVAFYVARRASSVPAIPGTGREKEWISVTDKLPDPNGTYLVASNWGVRAAYLHDPAWAQGCWQDALSKTDEGEMDFDYKQKGRFKVTHWMPLPAAPSHPSEAKAGEDA